MLQRQKELLNYLKALAEILKNIDIHDVSGKDLPLDLMQQRIENIELIVPVIGAFSAGKSFFLNAFLGQKYLLENLTPETALATELRYSASGEYIKAFKDDLNYEQVSLNEFESLKARAHEFAYLQIYLNNPHIKDIEPLVLVDMPGFESSLDSHQKAIMQYIGRASHYVVLINVQDGTLNTSLCRELRTIKAYGRDFTFLLSRCNRKPPSEVQAVQQEVQEKIEQLLNIHKDIFPIGKETSETIKKIFSKIDPNKLCDDVFLKEVQNLTFDIKNTLSTKISVLSEDTQKIQDSLQELQKSIEDLENKKTELIQELQDRYSSHNIRSIIDNVAKDLYESKTEIAHVAMNGGEGLLKERMSSIIKNSLMRHTQVALKDVSDNIVQDISFSLQDIGRILSEITKTENWVDEVSYHIQSSLGGLMNGLDQMIPSRTTRTNTSYSFINSLLPILLKVTHPLIQILLAILPSLIIGLFKKLTGTDEEGKKSKAIAKIEAHITEQVIPSTKYALQEKLPHFFNDQVSVLIEQISNDFASKIKLQSETIMSQQTAMQAQKYDTEGKIAQYNQCLLDIDSKAKEFLHH